MKQYSVLLPLLGYLGGCTVVEDSADRAAGASAAAPIRSEFVDGLILVEVALEGASGWWILDSGYEYSLVDSVVAAAAGLQFSEMETVDAPGGSVSQQWATSGPLALANGSWSPDSLAVLNFGGLAPFVGRPVAGLLGHDYFLDHVITIDYEEQRVTVAQPDAFTAPPGSTSIPVWIENEEPFALGFLWAAGRSVPAKLKIDTGSFSGLGLNGSFVAQNALVPGDWPRLEVTGVAVGGGTRNFIARLDSMSFGRIVIPKPVAAWSEDLTRIGDAGTLGAPILARFRVTFDYPRMRMLLEPEPGAGDPEVWDASGMLVVQPPGGDVIVAQLLPGGPAEQAGLRPGDAIRHIGIRPATELGLGNVRRHFRQPGRTDTLTVVREDGEHSVVLEQRQLP